MNANDLLTSPLAAVSSLVAVVAHFIGLLDAVIHTLWSLAPGVYPPLAVANSMLLPKIGTAVVPFVGAVDFVALGQQVTLIGAIIYIAWRLEKVASRFASKKDS